MDGRSVGGGHGGGGGVGGGEEPVERALLGGSRGVG